MFIYAWMCLSILSFFLFKYKKVFSEISLCVNQDFKCSLLTFILLGEYPTLLFEIHIKTS
jgi:hypothetical protein